MDHESDGYPSKYRINSQVQEITQNSMYVCMEPKSEEYPSKYGVNSQGGR